MVTDFIFELFFDKMQLTNWFFSSCRKQLRNAATRTFHDPNAIYSELILWRVDHIGPLSCTGGVSELARINSLHTSAFSNVAWLPTLIPSSVLGKRSAAVLLCNWFFADEKMVQLISAFDRAVFPIDPVFILSSQGLTVTVPAHALWRLTARTCASIKPWSMPGNYWMSCRIQKHLWVETNQSQHKIQISDS